MIIREVIENLHYDNLTSDQMKALLDELQKNTLLRYLGEFNLLPETFKKQLNLYLKDQKQFDHNHTTDVHNEIFLNKREKILKELCGIFENNLRTITDIIEEIKKLTDDDEMIEYLSFINKELQGGDTEYQIKLSLQYYLEKTETPEDVLGPLKDGMTALSKGDIYESKTYSCMPGLADRLIDRIGALMDSQEDDRRDTVYRDYAQSVLLNHVSGEGKLALMSALWYALSLPELAWAIAPTTKQQLYFNDQPICNLDEHGNQSAQEALFPYFESELIETSEWVKRNRSKLDKLKKGQAFNDEVMIDKISELEHDYKDYLRKNVETFLERHQGSVDTVARTFNEGSHFGYKDIHVDVTILKDGDIDEVLSIAQQNFEAHDEEHLLIEMCKTLKLDIVQLRCILLGVADGLDGLFREMYEAQSSEKADKLMSIDGLKNRTQTQYEERIVKSSNVYRYWQDDFYESRLYLFETLPNKNDLLTKLHCISEDVVLSYIENNELIDSMDALVIESVRSGFIEVTKQLLKFDRVNINMRFANMFGEEETLLLLASRMGHSELVSQLLQYGIDVNETGSDEKTALMLSLRSGHLNTVMKLLEHRDIKINFKDSAGVTALHYAVLIGNVYAARLLCEQSEINVNESNNDGMTALFLALQVGYLDVAKILLNHKDIDVNICMEDGMSTLMYWASRGNVEIVSLLCKQKGISVNYADDCGDTALSLSVSFGHLDSVRILLNHENIDVNNKDGHGNTPLHKAAKDDNVDKARLLCEHKDIDVNIKDSRGNTALHEAVHTGNVDLARLLCSHEGIDANIKDTRGNTALHEAVRKGNLDVARLLCSHECIDVNIKNKHGNTALHIIAKSGSEDLMRVFCNSEDLMRLLCNHENIDVNIKNNAGDTPLKAAALKDNKDLVELLYNYEGIHENTAPHTAVLTEIILLMNWIKSPLSWVAQKNEDAVLLVKHGFEYFWVTINHINQWLAQKAKSVYNWCFDLDASTGINREPSVHFSDKSTPSGQDTSGKEKTESAQLNKTPGK